jgi:4-alpha-glucanotransferase
VSKKFGPAVPTLETRAAGILLHPTSLPNDFPVGDLGPAAYRFANFLSHSRQRWWQMLPVGPAGPGDSPYQALSAFAGSPLLISPEMLYQAGLLKSADLDGAPTPGDRVDYGSAGPYKDRLLRKAFEAFEGERDRSHLAAFQAYVRRERDWLPDYALFSALRERYDLKDWTRWDPDIRARKPSALAAARKDLAPAIRFHEFVQWQFAEQWHALKAYCAERQIGLLGDVPIFVAPNSADVWANPGLFLLKEDGKPKVVAGVPPDYFSKTGQRWGNPHYRWDALKRTGYRWWIQRFAKTFELFDAVRLDHFIGFVRYYEVPGDAETAEKGQYKKGPGAHFFKAVFRKLGRVQFIAEDLGTVTPEVKALRDQFALPGMKVLQFAFGKDPEARNYQPHRYPINAVAYTGTHDNDTTVGWFEDQESASSTRSKKDIDEERAFTLEYLHSDGREIHWDMIRAALSSVAATAIYPMQDVLGLKTDARMNRPGVANGNWGWRMKDGMITREMTERLRKLTEAYER